MTVHKNITDFQAVTEAIRDLELGGGGSGQPSASGRAIASDDFFAGTLAAEGHPLLADKDGPTTVYRPPFAYSASGSAGVPGIDFTNDWTGGWVRCFIDSADEAQSCTITTVDQELHLGDAPIAEIRLAFDSTSGATAPKVKFGLSSFVTLSMDITNNPAVISLVVGKTSTPVGTLAPLTAQVWKIDATNKAAVIVSIDGEVVGTADLSATSDASATSPLFTVSKNGGADNMLVYADYLTVSCARTGTIQAD